MLKQAKARENVVTGGKKRLWGVKSGLPAPWPSIAAHPDRSLACEVCHVRWNRDVSAAYNMLWLFVFQCIKGGLRPDGFFVKV